MKTKSLIVVIACLVAFIGLETYWYMSGSATHDNSKDFRLSAALFSGMNFQDLSDFFSTMAQEKGGAYAFDVLIRAADGGMIPPNIDLHLLGHLVGNALYEQEGVQGIRVCTNALRNACSHSIVVGAFLEQGIPAIREVADVCKQAPGGKGAYPMCVHGLGHGVLASVDYDMKEAVKLCEMIGRPEMSDRIYGECTGGIAMEMMAGVHDPEVWNRRKTEFFDPQDPLAPCNRGFLSPAAQAMCYNFLTPHLFEAVGANLGKPTPEDYKKAFVYCGRIPREQTSNRVACYGGFGKEFPVLVSDRNVQKVEHLSTDQLTTIHTWCQLARVSDGMWHCANAALQSLYWGGENDPRAAVQFCSLSPKSYQDQCFESLLQSIAYYMGTSDAAYREGVCALMSDEYSMQCRAALHI